VTARYRWRVATKPVRFAVVDPTTGLHCGGWRVWARKSDVYLSGLDLGRRIKVSLHPGSWRVAFTQEHWSTGKAPNNAPGPGRSIWEIEHLPRLDDGVQHAWFITVSPEALISKAQLKANVEILEAPPHSEVIKINIWICDRTTTKEPQFPISGSPLPLADGRRVWVGRERFPYDRSTPLPATPVRGTVVEFARPEQPGDTPGFVIRPLYLDTDSPP
jgi:hypothetical protein